MNKNWQAHLIPGTWCLVDFFHSVRSIRGDIARILPLDARSGATAVEADSEATETARAQEELKQAFRGTDDDGKDEISELDGKFVRFLTHFHGDQ